LHRQPEVLIIEDAAEIATIFAEILQMNGMKVELIMDGALAMERLNTLTPDLILLDMHLPKVSGLEILTYIRENPRLQKVRVIAITANALLTADLEDKADLTLLKPVTFSQISELSARILGIEGTAD
jgi:two-component system response regulator AdeR